MQRLIYAGSASDLADALVDELRSDFASAQADGYSASVEACDRLESNCSDLHGAVTFSSAVRDHWMLLTAGDLLGQLLFGRKPWRAGLIASRGKNKWNRRIVLWSKGPVARYVGVYDDPLDGWGDLSWREAWQELVDRFKTFALRRDYKNYQSDLEVVVFLGPEELCDAFDAEVG